MRCTRQQRAESLAFIASRALVKAEEAIKRVFKRIVSSTVGVMYERKMFDI